ncbi:MAG: tetratricopeptide repeat protein [Candidatus Moduliflexus flocculans]|nr:tetratricopeptide repeat protein [Candidatus Moduliflexus flocculans]
MAALQAEVQSNQGSDKAVNALGVLYARYGLYEKAEQQFQKTIATKEFVPGLINLGNIQYRTKNPDKAQEYFERAYKADSTNPFAILSLARIHHEGENYGLVRKLYAELQKRSPGLAMQFAYLDLKGEEAARAADIAKAEETIVWAE